MSVPFLLSKQPGAVHGAVHGAAHGWYHGQYHVCRNCMHLACRLNVSVGHCVIVRVFIGVG